MRVRESKVKTSRRLGIALTPKAAKYMERRPYPPGQHGPSTASKKLSNYGLQLLEKQRLRAQYNISEKQMQICHQKASRMKGSKIDNIIQFLETRLDAVVLRSGFARTIFAARQYVTHAHLTVNGRMVNVPSYRVSIKDVVSVREKSRRLAIFAGIANAKEFPQPPEYLVVDNKELTVRFKYLPTREEVPVTCNVQSIVEFYSR